MSDTPSSGALWALGIVGTLATLGAMASEMRQADARAGVNQGSRARAPKIPDLSLTRSAAVAPVLAGRAR